MEIEIIKTFWRYPDGGKREEYPSGWRVTASASGPVTPADAASWVAKGLAREVAPAPGPIAPAPTAEEAAQHE